MPLFSGKGYENCFLFLIWAISGIRGRQKNTGQWISAVKKALCRRGSGAHVQGLVVDTSSTVTKWKVEYYGVETISINSNLFPYI